MNHKPTIFLSRLLCSAALFSTWVAAALVFGNDRPNILFVMCDDHAYQAISAYGSNRNQTPHIDRIAAAGMRFDRCYVTNSICSPSRACILTGKYGHKNGVRDNYTKFDGSQQTFPKLLQKAGYQTAIIGKWHLKSDPTGFDHWDILPGQGKYYRPVFRTPAGVRDVPGYVTDITTDLAIDWLSKGRDKDRPFCLMVHHKAPHRPWDPGPDELTALDDVVFPDPETLFDDYQGRTSAARDAEMRLEQMRPRDVKIWKADNRHRTWLYDHMRDDVREEWKKLYDPRYGKHGEDNSTGHARRKWIYQLYLRDYMRCINSVDKGVGRLLDCLDGLDFTKNTIVVYTSDQGFYLGEHGWFDKRFMYEQSLRTPLLVRGPGVSPQIVTKPIVSNLDFAPTFLDLAGADIPADMQGKSLVPILAGQIPEDWRDTFYYHYHEGPDRDHKVARHDGVTNGRYKLINFYENKEWELFDLQSDPQELTSVYGQPDYRKVESEMTEALRQHRQTLQVPGFEETGG